MFKKIYLFFIPNKWETVWLAKCKSHSSSPIWGYMGKVSTIVKLQIEERKNKHRCIVTDGVTSNKVDLNYILTTSNSQELYDICEHYKINY